MGRFLNLVVALLIAGPLLAYAEAENVLSVFVSEIKRQGSLDLPSPVTVTARAQFKGGTPILSLRLTNVSDRPVSLIETHLPWGHPDSLIIAAQTTDGRRLINHYPIEDHFFAKDLSIAPGQSLEGDYDLNYRLARIPRDRDVILMWAYPLLERDRSRPWPIVTGVVVIPRAVK